MSISFIIPVFNTKSNLLKKCVSSIEKMRITDYEIIIINDGSNESNTREYESFLGNKKNVIYIKNANKGVSYSRNCGIKKASKEYITFVDSDDTVVCECLNNRDVKLTEDIVLLTYYNKTTRRSNNYSFAPGLVTRNTLLKEAVSTCNYCGSVAKLFKREYLISHNIMFDESFIQGEDALFNLYCLEFNPIIRYYNILFYEYNYSGSSTENRWEKNFEKCLANKYYIYSKKRELIRSFCMPNERKDYYIENDKEFVRSVFHTYKFLIAINDDKKLKRYVDKFKNTNLDKKNLGLKERLYYDLLVSDSIFTRRIVGLIRKIR